MADFNYVRRISDHTEILMCGYTDFTGQFDDAEYEQIESSNGLPEGAKFILTMDAKEQLFSLFMQLPVMYRAAFYTLVVQMNHAMTFGDTEGAAYMLQAVAVPPDLVPLKNQALEFFGIVNKSDTVTFMDSIADEVV